MPHPYEITARSLLRRRDRLSPELASRASFALYRNCAHACEYCEGRAEGFHTPGTFGVDVGVKINADTVLRRELDPSRRRKEFHPGFVVMGSGIGDCYQPLEERYCLSRRCLQVIADAGHAVHVQTKSPLVTRDIDLLTDINHASCAMVSFSFCAVDNEVASVFEPNAPRPTERLRAMSRLRDAGLHCGMVLEPVLPFLTDSPSRLEKAFKAAQSVGADFVALRPLRLRQGVQHDRYLSLLDQCAPGRAHDTEIVYTDNRVGLPDEEYRLLINRIFLDLAASHSMQPRLPVSLANRVLDTNDFVVCALGLIDRHLRDRGQSSMYRIAANAVAGLQSPLESMLGNLRSVRGIGPRISAIVRELVETRRSRYYSGLVSGSVHPSQARRRSVSFTTANGTPPRSPDM